MKKQFLVLGTIAFAFASCTESTIVRVPATGVEISSFTDEFLFVGGSKTMDAILAPKDAYPKDVEWKIADESIATIENFNTDKGFAECILKGQKEGTTTLTATAVNGGAKGTQNVAVYELKGKVFVNSNFLAYLQNVSVVLNGQSQNVTELATPTQEEKESIQAYIEEYKSQSGSLENIDISKMKVIYCNSKCMNVGEYQLKINATKLSNPEEDVYCLLTLCDKVKENKNLWNLAYYDKNSGGDFESFINDFLNTSIKVTYTLK